MSSLQVGSGSNWMIACLVASEYVFKRGDQSGTVGSVVHYGWQANDDAGEFAVQKRLAWTRSAINGPG